MDCFAEPVIGRRFAPTRWLAMTQILAAAPIQPELISIWENTTQKKAARFPRRPFLSYGSSTLTGDFRTSAPGAYLPAVF
jgi:hypothetical protein